MAYRIDSDNELKTHLSQQDIRKLHVRIHAWLKTHKGGQTFCMLGAGFCFIAALFTPVLGLVIILILVYFLRLYSYPKRNRYDAPYRVPAYSQIPDGSIVNPSGKPFSPQRSHEYFGKGTEYFGVSRLDSMGVWATVADTKTHSLILGGTGSGKTELLYTLIHNQLLNDSGFVLIDAKADIALLGRITTMAFRYYRHEDLYVLTFAGGKKDMTLASYYRKTNTFNFMADGGLTPIIETLTALISTSKGGSDMWEKRCLGLIEATSKPLVYLRDKEIIDLSPAVYNDYFDMATLENLTHGKLFHDVEGLHDRLQGLREFFVSLPGYQKSKYDRGEGQEQKTLEQFGYLTMQVTKVFNDLSHNYGHIFNTPVGDIDIYDIITARRMLVVLIPALERSVATLNSLGRLVIGSIKQMLATSVGVDVEGYVSTIIEARATDAVNVFRVIADEVGYIMVEGFAIIPAQARGLNIAMTFAAQSFDDLIRGNAQEAEAIFENTNTKFVGRFFGSDQSETYKMIDGLLGTVEVAAPTEWYSDPYSFSGKVKQTNTFYLREKKKIPMDVMQNQQDGEFLFITSKKTSSEDAGAGGGMGVPMKAMFIGFAKEETARVLKINDFVPLSKAGFKINSRALKTSLVTCLEKGGLHQALNNKKSQGVVPDLKILSDFIDKHINSSDVNMHELDVLVDNIVNREDDKPLAATQLASIGDFITHAILDISVLNKKVYQSNLHSVDEHCFDNVQNTLTTNVWLGVTLTMSRLFQTNQYNNVGSYGTNQACTMVTSFDDILESVSERHAIRITRRNETRVKYLPVEQHPANLIETASNGINSHKNQKYADI